MLAGLGGVIFSGVLPIPPVARTSVQNFHTDEKDSEEYQQSAYDAPVTPRHGDTSSSVALSYQRSALSKHTPQHVFGLDS